MRLEDFIKQSNEVNTVADVPHLKWGVVEDEVVSIRGITDPVFRGLNGSIALRIKQNVYKRLLDETGEFIRFEDGSLKFEEVSIPVGSACILSEIPLQIPFGYSYEKGFAFVDASLNPRKPGFLYIIPKEYLFRKPVIGLALSRKRMDSYRSVRVSLANYGNVYLHVIPFKPSKVYRATLILKTFNEALYDFREELTLQLQMWHNLGILLNVEEVEYNLFDVDTEEVCLGGIDFNET